MPCAVGHLTYLWWWALDYAPDGSLARYEADVIADACLWQGDAEMFVSALRTAGFLEPEMYIHDWFDYAGKLVLRRQQDAERKRVERNTGPTDVTQFTNAQETNGPDSIADPQQATPETYINEGNPADVHGTSLGHPADGAGSLAKPSLAKPSKAKRSGSDPRAMRGAPTLRPELLSLVTALLNHAPTLKQTRQLAYHDGLDPPPTEAQYREAIGRSLANATGDPIAYAMTFVHELEPNGATHGHPSGRPPAHHSGSGNPARPARDVAASWNR